MRRYLLALAAAVLATAAFAGVAHATGNSSSCVSAADATFHHTFDGAGGSATITAVRPLCDGEERTFSLVSYTTPVFVYDSDRALIDSGRRSVTLSVDVPACETRVEAFLGAGIIEEPTTGYGDLTLGSPGSRSSGVAGSYKGGDAECAPEPSVTFRSYCDGVLHTRLSNAADATVDAVFTVDGRLKRVAPGKHADLTSHPSGPVVVRDNTLTTSTGSWVDPADCPPAA
ncbi:hypothetical protein AB0M02_00040 [Actinoplanes sp. NPDC051861]|uniref:hypothetical protein n=1 Tax=Actinoplanes sp. NPDC051861 TaxID=3155170 RepID=UPI003445A76A